MKGQMPSGQSDLMRGSRSRLLMGASWASLLSVVVAGSLGSGPGAIAQTLDGGDAIAPAEPAPVDSVAPEPVAPEPVAPEPAFPAVPAVPESMAPAPVAPANEAYIDNTDYAIGATQRTIDLPIVSGTNARIVTGAMPSIPSSFQGSSGDGGYGLASVSTPSLKDFYRRTLRPPGRLGNGNMRLIFPLSLPAPITSLFGWRLHPISGLARFHTGTDLGAPMGTPVLAAYAGQVALADFLGGYGLAIALDHNKGKEQTLYAHLSEVFVKPGEWVKQGAVIGRVGSTGNSTGPHLHFEYREQTADGWVALDAGSHLEYALAELVKIVEVSEKGIANAQGLAVSQKGRAGISGKVEVPLLAQKPTLPTANTAPKPVAPRGAATPAGPEPIAQ